MKLSSALARAVRVGRPRRCHRCDGPTLLLRIDDDGLDGCIAFDDSPRSRYQRHRLVCPRGAG